MKPDKVKQATSETLTTTVEDYVNVLAFLQAVAVNSPHAIAAPLSLRVDMSARLVLSLDRR